jgi:hypothetical protein
VLVSHPFFGDKNKKKTNSGSFEQVIIHKCMGKKKNQEYVVCG